MPKFAIAPEWLDPRVSRGEAMRCFFNLVHTSQRLADRDGVEVGDLNEAREVAVETVAEMIREGEVRGVDLRGWHLEAAAASGAILFTLSLGALLH